MMQATVRIVGGLADGWVDRRTKVWLECNGEPYDLRSLSTAEIRSVDDVELVTFDCPRCGGRHQSLRFA